MFPQKALVCVSDIQLMVSAIYSLYDSPGYRVANEGIVQLIMTNNSQQATSFRLPLQHYAIRCGYRSKIKKMLDKSQRFDIIEYGGDL